MKRGESPDLSVKWWKSSQPKGLASAAKLESALKAHEAAISAFEKKSEADQRKAAQQTLDAVEDATAKVLAEAAKVKKSDEMEWTVQALKKLDFVKEAKALDAKLKSDGKAKAEGKDGDEENDDPASLADPVLYAKQLRKSLNRLQDEPWNWGFLVGKKPIEHRLLLHRSKQGRALAVTAAKDLQRAPKLSFGTVIRSPDDAETLLLTVEGPMLAGLATRCKKMLLKMKPQTISDVVLIVDGAVVQEAVDPNDLDADDETVGAPGTAPDMEALHQRIAALEPRAAAVMEALPAYKDRLTVSIAKLMDVVAGEDVTTAEPMLGKLEDIVTRLEGARSEATTTETETEEEPGIDPASIWAERLSLAKADLSILVKAADPSVRELGGLFMKADKAFKADTETAPAEIEALEDALMQAMRAARMREASANGMGITLRKLLLEWHTAQGKAPDALNAIGTLYLDDPEVQNDPRFDQVVATVKRMPQELPDFGDQLDDAINAVMNTGLSQSAISEALGVIEDYRMMLDASDLERIERVAQQDMAANFGIMRDLTGSLDKLDVALHQIGR